MAMLNARQARQTLEVVIDIGDGVTVRAQREDMTLLVFDGRVPMPLLAAVQRMIDMPGLTDMERLESLGETNSKDLIRVIREHAVAVLLEPRCSLEPTDDPDVLPVSYFSVPQLMQIWTETAVVPKVTMPQATRFRERAVDVVPDVAPTRADVPPAAKPVAVPAPRRSRRKIVNSKGKSVEYLGR